MTVLRRVATVSDNLVLAYARRYGTATSQGEAGYDGDVSGGLREDIVRHLKRGLEGDRSVYALWLEGSLATDQADDLSDIDLVADVEDGSQDRVFERAEELLGELGS